MLCKSISQRGGLVPLTPAVPCRIGQPLRTTVVHGKGRPLKARCEIKSKTFQIMLCQYKPLAILGLGARSPPPIPHPIQKFLRIPPNPAGTHMPACPSKRHMTRTS
eukprot:scaffold17187_cov17-Tisochrysis_lutea.AAC.1